MPEAETFNLLGEGEEVEKSVKEKEKKKAVDRSKAVTHLRSRIILSTMTEQVIAIFLSASSHLKSFVRFPWNQDKCLER